MKAQIQFVLQTLFPFICLLLKVVTILNFKKGTELKFLIDH